MRKCLAFVIVAGAISSTGCISTIPVRSVQPAAVNLGPVRTLAILDGEGRRSARETTYNELVTQARRNGYFTVADRSEEGAQVEVSGRGVALSGTPVMLPPDAARLRVDVIQWDTGRDTNTVTDARGRATTTTVTTATVLLAATVFDASGRASIAEKEYAGTVQSANPNDSADYLLAQAASQAVARFLAEITPREVTRNVRLDDSEEAMKPMIDTARAGNLAQAAADFTAYAQSHPNSAAAAYNVAVVLDAMGRYQEALGWYDRALQIGNKDFYSTARAECAARMAAAQALTGW